MKPSLIFCVPAHDRVELSRICLGQLRRTCDLLEREGIRASAIVVADDENLDTARELGFGTVERDNRFLGVKFNDALQLACDPARNPYPADYAVPCGSDDWVDHRLFLELPERKTMVGFQRLAVVREDGREISVRDVSYTGGAGIRIWPARILRELGYRPCDEDRKRGCDTSILYNLQRALRFTIEHRHLHDYQIVDWKSPDAQLNTYEELGRFRASSVADPFEVLADFYPAESLAAIRALYASRMEVAA
jgi:hypothetical protein